MRLMINTNAEADRLLSDAQAAFPSLVAEKMDGEDLADDGSNEGCQPEVAFIDGPAQEEVHNWVKDWM